MSNITSWLITKKCYALLNSLLSNHKGFYNAILAEFKIPEWRETMFTKPDPIAQEQLVVRIEIQKINARLTPWIAHR